MKIRFRHFWAVLFLLWIIVVIAAYFVIQKPWPSNITFAPIRAIMDALFASIILLIAGGIGRRWAGALGSLHPLEGLAIQSGIGLGTISLIILGVGLLGWLSPLSAWIGLALGVLIFHRDSMDWLRQVGHGVNPSDSMGGGAALALLFLGILLLISLLDSLAPPTKWDSLVYHLELPRHYVAVGRIGFVSGNLFVGFPQLAEMNYTWALALSGGRAAATLGWGVGVTALLGLAGFAHRLTGKLGFYLAPMIVLGGISLWQGLAWAYVDHWVLLYGVILFITLDAYSRHPDKRWLVLAGVAIGFAVSAKYTGALLGSAAVLWLLLDRLADSGEGAPARSYWDRSKRELPQLVPEILLVAGVALLLFMPWLLKNLITTGNPLYPFLWPGREVDMLRQTFHAQESPTRDLLSLVLLPWNATILGVEGGAGFNSSIGPFYLALLPGLLLGFGGRDEEISGSLRRLSSVALLVWFLWGIGGLIADPLTRSRHYYGFLPAIAVAAVAGYQNLRQLRLGRIKVGWVISRLVFFGFFLVVLDGLFYLAGRPIIPTIAGHKSEQEFISDQLGWYGPAMEYLGQLPADSEVEMLWEARSYYCPVQCNPDVILDKWWHWQRTMGNGEQIENSLRQKGVTHVLIYDFGARFERERNEFIQPEDWRALSRFREQQLQLVERFGEGYSLYTWQE